MPLTIYVKEDQTVQYSPNESSYYSLKPHFEDYYIIPPTEKSYQKLEINKDDQVLLRSIGIHHCHTIIVKDINKDNYFMMHVSPYALDRPYDLIQKKAKIFGQNPTPIEHKIEATKPAYIDVDPYYYDLPNIGISKDSKLEVIIIVNHEYAHEIEKILPLFQQRILGIITKTNVIVTDALKYGWFYNVEFDVQKTSLRIISLPGTIDASYASYDALYSSPFKDDNHHYVTQKLSEDQYIIKLSNALKEELKNVESITDLFWQKGITSADQLILNTPPEIMAEKSKIVNSITAIKYLMGKRRFPSKDFDSSLLHSAYAVLGLFYSVIGDYTYSGFYLKEVADYSTSNINSESSFKIFISPLYYLMARAAYKGCKADKLADECYELYQKISGLNKVETTKSNSEMERTDSIIKSGFFKSERNLNSIQQPNEEIKGLCLQKIKETIDLKKLQTLYYKLSTIELEIEETASDKTLYFCIILSSAAYADPEKIRKVKKELFENYLPKVLGIKQENIDYCSGSTHVTITFNNWHELAKVINANMTSEQLGCN